MKIIRSILDPEYVLKDALTKYSIKSNKCYILKGCGSNDIYQVGEGTKKYIVKIYSIRACWPYTKEHFLFEARFQSFLREVGISAPLPIKNQCEELVSVINTPEYSKFYILYSYEKGKAWEHNNKENDRIYLLGQELAKLHKESNNFPDRLSHRKLDLDFLINNTYIRIKQKGNIKIEKLLNKIDYTFNTLSKEIANIKDWPLNIIHGDLHPGNHLFNLKKNKIIFLDFELTGYGYKIYDLAVFKWDLLQTHPLEFVDNTMQYLINGYMSIDNTIKSQLPYIDLFVKLRSFFMLGSSFLFYPEAPQCNNEYLINNYLDRIIAKNK